MSALVQKIVFVLDKVCDEIIAHEQFLSDLDRRIGDGDHGANMKRGCLAIKQALPELQKETPTVIANKCAMLLLSKVGGASGPLLASGLMKIAKEIPADSNEIELASKQWFLKALKSFTAGIKERGKAELDDKTFLDYLLPFIAKFEELLTTSPEDSLKQLIQKATVAGETGKEHTVQIVAKKGRASYLGDRSIGTADPGASSMAIIFKAIGDSI